eukprot:1682721-Alexandrium_andersonii.AAC.1
MFGRGIRASRCCPERLAQIWPSSRRPRRSGRVSPVRRPERPGPHCRCLLGAVVANASHTP